MAEDTAKRAAGEAAAAEITDGMLLGLGTGSTVRYFLEAVAAAAADVRGVPTSVQTAERCRALGIPTIDLDDGTRLDLCVDGADELTPALALTKGGGGALLREKVVAAASRRMLVIATPDKVVERLGSSFPIPVEVVPFAIGPVTARLRSLGADVRVRGDGAYRTDNGNAILDARFPDGIDDPRRIHDRVGLLPGVAETGLFIDMADRAILGRPDGTVTELVADRPS